MAKDDDGHRTGAGRGVGPLIEGKNSHWTGNGAGYVNRHRARDGHGDVNEDRGLAQL